jgi:hypothetical protein
MVNSSIRGNSRRMKRFAPRDLFIYCGRRGSYTGVYTAATRYATQGFAHLTRPWTPLEKGTPPAISRISHLISYRDLSSSACECQPTQIRISQIAIRLFPSPSWLFLYLISKADRGTRQTAVEAGVVGCGGNEVGMGTTDSPLPVERSG